MLATFVVFAIAPVAPVPAREALVRPFVHVFVPVRVPSPVLLSFSVLPSFTSCLLLMLLRTFWLIHFQVKLGSKAASISLSSDAAKTATINGDLVFGKSR